MISLGIDFGTSGARAIALATNKDADTTVVAEARHAFEPGEVSSPTAWQQVLWQLLDALDASVRDRLTRIAINGTSATVLLCDDTAQPVTDALLYNDTSARETLADIQGVAPPGSPTLSATSSLTKALWWHKTLAPPQLSKVSLLCHQADWLSALLHGGAPVSDYHNALKLGYDVRSLTYPAWLLSLPIASWLPTVKAPGDVIAPISSATATRFGIPPTCQIRAGTTDSIAAFIASGASTPGDAVTSLGSTLVLKLLSRCPIDDETFGIYSHRLGDLWLVGGASNTGGAVLKKYFSAPQLAALTEQIDITQPCELNYYPLNAPGERFPINDPDYLPRLTPRPAQDADFLYGLLDAIARIESEGYQKLQSLGSPAIARVYTAGGGAKNAKWQLLRARYLGVEVSSAEHTEAAYGTAKLAMDGLSAYKGDFS
ncbi:MAG: FGGY-family carbohydrate kinase [Cyanobacteria bacterium J06581_3]